MLQMHQKLYLLIYLSHERALTTLSDIDYAQNLHLASTNERKESLKVRVRWVNVCAKGEREREWKSWAANNQFEAASPPSLVCFRRRRWWSHAASTRTRRRTRRRWERSFRLLPRHNPPRVRGGAGGQIHWEKGRRLAFLDRWEF